MAAPYAARYQQNAGLAAGANYMHDLNDQIASRGTPAYRPQGIGPSGMRSYGGAYGLGGRDPLGQNRLTDQQVYNGMARPGYQPMGASPLGMAPMNQAGYDQQMAAQNPNARFFGGLLPTNITGPGGSQRVGYMQAPAQPGVGQADQNSWAGANGMAVAMRPDGTASMGPSGALGSMSNRDIRLAGITGRGPSGKERLNPGGREAYQAGLAQRQAAAREQTLNRVAMRSGLAGQPATAQPGQPDQWAGLAQLGTHLGGLVQAGVLQPDQAQMIMQQKLGATGMKIPPSRENPLAVKARQQLGPEKMAAFAALKTPQERDAFLNAHGISDPALRNHLHSQMGVGQTPAPGLLGGIYNGLIDRWAGGKDSEKYSRPTKQPGPGGLIPKTYPPAPAPTPPLTPETYPWGGFYN